MPKPTKGPRLGGSSSHQKAILANLATSLFEHGRIKTTEPKARALRPHEYAEAATIQDRLREGFGLHRAMPYPADGGSDAVKTLLANQITHSVQWMQSVRYLMAQGVTQFSETGPGNVLTRMVQQIQQQKDI